SPEVEQLFRKGEKLDIWNGQSAAKPIEPFTGDRNKVAGGGKSVGWGSGSKSVGWGSSKQTSGWEAEAHEMRGAGSGGGGGVARRPYGSAEKNKHSFRRCCGGRWCCPWTPGPASRAGIEGNLTRS